MENKEILINAIKKAEKNDYNFEHQHILDGCSYRHTNDVIRCTSFLNGLVLCNGAPIDELHQQVAVRDIIFSHDFAKAFWGEGCECGVYNKCTTNGITCCKCEKDWCGWEFHLQRMVLEKEPLKYLEGYL